METINDFLGRLDKMELVGLDHKDLVFEWAERTFRLEHRLKLSQHSMTRIDCVLYLIGIAPDGSRHTVQIWGVEELEPFTRWYWAKYHEANDLTYAQETSKKDVLTGVYLAD